jgi:hypothetical protein
MKTRQIVVHSSVSAMLGRRELCCVMYADGLQGPTGPDHILWMCLCYESLYFIGPYTATAGMV